MQSDMMNGAGQEKPLILRTRKKPLALAAKYEYKSNHEPRPEKHAGGA